MRKELNDLLFFIRNHYQTDEVIPLHAPLFGVREQTLLLDCLDSTYVSSVGKYVESIEERICSITGSKYAIATVNGTSALHISLLVAGVSQDTEVLTQAASFVATCNAISYCGAIPSFLDINPNTLGLSSCALRQFLVNNCVLEQGKCYNNKSGRRISACVPMHTFGHPCDAADPLLYRFNIFAYTRNVC